MNSSTMFVSRVDGSRAKGWQVRIERKSFTTRRFFSDSKFGGKQKAKREAMKARDEIVRKNGVQMDPPDGVLMFKNGKPIWMKDDFSTSHGDRSRS